MSPQIVSWSFTFLKMRHLINSYLLNPVSFSSSQQDENSKIMFPNYSTEGKTPKSLFFEKSELPI